MMMNGPHLLLNELLPQNDRYFYMSAVLLLRAPSDDDGPDPYEAVCEGAAVVCPRT